jgi:hypothetical protein
MGVIEQVARYDEQVNAVRAARHRHYCDQIAASILHLQRQGIADPALDPDIAATAIGAMTSRFAELWLVDHFVDCSIDDAVEQLTLLYVNALGLRETASTERRPAVRR